MTTKQLFVVSFIGSVTSADIEDMERRLVQKLKRMGAVDPHVIVIGNGGTLGTVDVKKGESCADCGCSSSPD